MKGLCSLLVMLCALPVFGQQGAIIQYPLRLASAAGNVCAGPDGNTWFVFTGISAVGTISPTGAVGAFLVPLSGVTLTPSLVGCAFGPDGRLYFSDQNNKKVIAFTPGTQTFTRYSVPAPNAGIAGLAFGADGNAWIMVAGSSAIRRMTVGGAFLPAIQLTAGRFPHGPSSCPDGNVWFVEHNANRVAKADQFGRVTEFLLPQSNSLPFSTACGPDGMYFTQEIGRIGRITYGTLTFTQWKTPTSMSKPTGIAVGASGNVYFAETAVSKIGIMPVGGGTITEYVIVGGVFPDKLVAGSDRRVWFSQHNVAQVGAIQ